MNRNLDEMMESPKWNQIYRELFKHQEIFMKAMNDKAKRLALCEEELTSCKKELADLQLNN
jgi:hypothetical protein